jgi:hypothetical protein
MEVDVVEGRVGWGEEKSDKLGTKKLKIQGTERGTAEEGEGEERREGRGMR